jgi:hypothetical protein
MGPFERSLTTVDIEGKHKHRYPISQPDKERLQPLDDVRRRGDWSIDGSFDKGITQSALPLDCSRRNLKRKINWLWELHLQMALAMEGPDLDDSMKVHSSNSGQSYAGKYCDTCLDVSLLSSVFRRIQQNTMWYRCQRVGYRTCTMTNQPAPEPLNLLHTFITQRQRPPQHGSKSSYVGCSNLTTLESIDREDQ